MEKPTTRFKFYLLNSVKVHETVLNLLRTALFCFNSRVNRGAKTRLLLGANSRVAGSGCLLSRKASFLRQRILNFKGPK